MNLVWPLTWAAGCPTWSSASHTPLSSPPPAGRRSPAFPAWGRCRQRWRRWSGACRGSTRPSCSATTTCWSKTSSTTTARVRKSSATEPPARWRQLPEETFYNLRKVVNLMLIWVTAVTAIDASPLPLCQGRWNSSTTSTRITTTRPSILAITSTNLRVSASIGTLTEETTLWLLFPRP